MDDIAITENAPSSLARARPAWMTRLFGIETASLIACDALEIDGAWQRPEPCQFLYVSTRGFFFLLSGPESWVMLSRSDAARCFDALPMKLAEREQALAPVAIEPRRRSEDEEADTSIYTVVRNDDHAYSIWLEYKPLPRGWSPLGVRGTRTECLDHIHERCVFGAPPLPDDAGDAVYQSSGTSR